MKNIKPRGSFNSKGKMLSFPPLKCALIVAHPGHELRVHGWLETAKPKVFVFTDGSGRSGVSRLNSTTQLLSRAKAQAGSLYGYFTDCEIYNAVLRHEFEVFIRLAKELAQELIHGEFQFVLGDAAEGYNPSHDICRLVIGAALEVVRRKTGHQIPNFDFLLAGRPTDCPEALHAKAFWLTLDDEALARKREAALRYAELANEADMALGRRDPNAFRVECLRPCDNHSGYEDSTNGAPYYERYGEKQVGAGHYQQVIRYREHMLPLARALWDFVEKGEWPL